MRSHLAKLCCVIGLYVAVCTIAAAAPGYQYTVVGNPADVVTSTSGLTSAEGLADPFHRDLTLDRDFLTLPMLGGLITDQHLQERDRMGRTITFLARLVRDGWTPQAHAIAADRETALHVDPSTGAAEVFTTPDHPTPFVYFLTTPGPPEICEPGIPLTYRNVAVYRIGPGNSFDVNRWRGTGGIAYTLSVEAGALSSSRGEIY